MQSGTIVNAYRQFDTDGDGDISREGFTYRVGPVLGLDREDVPEDLIQEVYDCELSCLVL